MIVAHRRPATAWSPVAKAAPWMSSVHTAWVAIPLLIVAEHERKRLAICNAAGVRLVFHDRAAALRQRLESHPARAVIIETHDCDGVSVGAAIRRWVEQNPLFPVIVWTAVHDSAMREVLDLAFAGADVRLVLRGRDELAIVLEHLFERPLLPHPGAVTVILRHIVRCAPPIIQPALALGVYHAWPRPSVAAWSESLGVTRQALNARLAAVGFAPASVVMDCFNAAEIAIRCSLGMKLKQIALEMGRLDDRALRRRLDRLGCRPEELLDERDFLPLLPRISQLIAQGP